MALRSDPARRRYPASTVLSTCGRRSDSLATWLANSGSSSLTSETSSPPASGDCRRAEKREGRRFIDDARLLPGGGAGAGGSMIVCERDARLGTARGPPGREGELDIFTGRGLGIAFAGLFCNRFKGGGLRAPR